MNTKSSPLKIDNIEQIISESLSECIENIFDQRNPEMINESIEFVQCLRSVVSCDDKDISSIIQESIDVCMEKIYLLEENDVTINHFLNMKDNMSNHIIGNQSLPDVSVFTTLYDKGYIKDSYMRKHIVRQTHSLKSTLSDLMGRDWVSRALRPHTPQTSLNDWIDCDIIFEWNRKLLSSDIDGLPSVEDMVRALMFQTKDLLKSIADGTYEDMCVNAVMCYEFAALTALIAKQESHQNLIKSIITRMILFGNKFGKNGFFICCCIIMNLLYAKISLDSSSDVDRTANIWKSDQTAELLNTWATENQKITLPNKDIFPCELSSLLGTLEQTFDFKVTSEDAKILRLPTPILMIERIQSENNDERQSGMILEESVKIGQGLTEVETFETNVGDNDSLMENSSSSLDSLVERFQVESGDELMNNLFETLSPAQIHSTIMENQNRLFHNALRHESDALKSNIAANFVMMEELHLLLDAKSDTRLDFAERTLLEADLSQMGYHNSKYIGIVGTDSKESVKQYAENHRRELLDDMAKIANGV